jgi:hypothetical protein
MFYTRLEETWANLGKPHVNCHCVTCCPRQETAVRLPITASSQRANFFCFVLFLRHWSVKYFNCQYHLYACVFPVRNLYDRVHASRWKSCVNSQINLCRGVTFKNLVFGCIRHVEEYTWLDAYVFCNDVWFLEHSSLVKNNLSLQERE